MLGLCQIPFLPSCRMGTFRLQESTRNAEAHRGLFRLSSPLSPFLLTCRLGASSPCLGWHRIRAWGADATTGAKCPSFPIQLLAAAQDVLGTGYAARSSLFSAVGLWLTCPCPVYAAPSHSRPLPEVPCPLGRIGWTYFWVEMPN